VRRTARAGLYGAKITGGGSGGTVAVRANTGERVDAAIGEIVAEYGRRTGRAAEVFGSSSPGAWEVGTVEVNLRGQAG
jgi:L-arabinokinase